MVQHRGQLTSVKGHRGSILDFAGHCLLPQVLSPKATEATCQLPGEAVFRSVFLYGRSRSNSTHFPHVIKYYSYFQFFSKILKCKAHSQPTGGTKAGHPPGLAPREASAGPGLALSLDTMSIQVTSPYCWPSYFFLCCFDVTWLLFCRCGQVWPD